MGLNDYGSSNYALSDAASDESLLDKSQDASMKCSLSLVAFGLYGECIISM